MRSVFLVFLPVASLLQVVAPAKTVPAGKHSHEDSPGHSVKVVRKCKRNFTRFVLVRFNHQDDVMQVQQLLIWGTEEKEE